MWSTVSICRFRITSRFRYTVTKFDTSVDNTWGISRYRFVEGEGERKRSLDLLCTITLSICKLFLLYTSIYTYTSLVSLSQWPQTDTEYRTCTPTIRKRCCCAHREAFPTDTYRIPRTSHSSTSETPWVIRGRFRYVENRLAEASSKPVLSRYHTPATFHPQLYCTVRARPFRKSRNILSRIKNLLNTWITWESRIKKSNFIKSFSNFQIFSPPQFKTWEYFRKRSGAERGYWTFNFFFKYLLSAILVTKICIFERRN